MKNPDTISSFLGITQHDAAMLLGINRGQWSMYESGKRDLPLAAKLKLVELLKHAKERDAAKRILPASPESTLLKFEQLLDKNQYLIYKIDRQIAVAERKQASRERLQQLSAFLDTGMHGKSAALGAQIIAAKASKSVKVKVQDATALLQHRREVLTFEIELLESKIRALKPEVQEPLNADPKANPK